MKRAAGLSILLILFNILSAQSEKTLKKVLELKIPREGGANGAGVAWHPAQKKYFAAMAGNTGFFIGVYDATGKLQSPDTLQALFDIRGIWYNPVSKTIQMNGYNDFGWGEYKLNAKGFPVSVNKLHTGLHQPDEQCAGAFNPTEKVLYFFNEDGEIDIYNFASAEYKDGIALHLGVASPEDKEDHDNYDVLEDYNSTSVIFTGLKKAELGLLNVLENRIELYSSETGLLTQNLLLPDEAPVNETLNFAFCNGIYWLFHKESRIWMGYK